MTATVPRPVATEAATFDRPGALAAAGIIAAYVAVFLVAVPAAAWSLGSRFDDLLSLPAVPAAHRPAHLVFGTLGLVLMVWAMGELSVKGRGLPISHLPPTRLVTTGPYAVMRHPIYVGFLAAMGGFGGWSGSAGRAFVATPLLALAVVDYTVGREALELDVRHTGRDHRHATVTTRVARSVLRPTWMALRPGVECLANRVVLSRRRGGTIWVTYGLFVAIGGVVGLTLAASMLSAGGLGGAEVALYLVYAAVGVAAGGRVGWLFTAASRRAGLARRRTVGFVSWGSYAGYLVANLWAAVSLDVGYWWLVDHTLVPALLASAIGRVGCLTYGCCYGRVWADGIRWTDPDAKVLREQGVDVGGIRRVPCQVLASVATVGATAVAVVCSAARPAEGVVSAMLMLLYGMSRFAVDSCRDPVFRGERGFTSGQVYSLLLAAAALALLLSVDAGSRGFDRPLYELDVRAMLVASPTALLLGVLGFVAAGYHRDHVGRW